MLQDDLRRDGIRKYIAAILFGAIILVFALFGVSQRGPEGNTGYAARVNEQVISLKQYREALEQMIGYYSQMFGGNFDAETQKRMQVRSAALDQLISRAATSQAARNAGFMVPIEEIRDIILNVPIFQKDGKFIRENYDKFLSSRSLSASQFEDDLRRDLLAQKVREFFQIGLTPNDLELDLLMKYSQDQFNVEFVTFDAVSLKPLMKVSTKEIEDFVRSDEGKKKAKEEFDLNGQAYREAGKDLKLDDGVQKKIAESLLRTERATKWVEGTKAIAESGDQGKLSGLLKDVALKWQESGPFTLADDMIPKLGTYDAMFDAVSKLSPEAPFHKGLVNAGATNYLIRLKSRGQAKDVKSVEDRRKELYQKLTSTRGRDVYMKWSEEIIKTSHIEKNRAILAEESTQ